MYEVKSRKAYAQLWGSKHFLKEVRYVYMNAHMWNLEKWYR